MKKKILLLMGVFAFGILHAQIGVNTENPLNPFHVDAAGDNNAVTPTAAQLSNDVVFTANGNLGIGTNTPQARVDVNGSFRYVDGNERAGRFLRSDALGNATWQDFSIIDIAIWDLVSNGYQTIANNENRLSGTLAIPKDTGIGITSQAATSSVVVPAGRYVIFITSDMYDDGAGAAKINENGWFNLFETGSGVSIFSGYYSMMLSGACAYLDTPTSVSLYPTFTPVNDGLTYFNTAPFSTRYMVRLTFMRI